MNTIKGTATLLVGALMNTPALATNGYLAPGYGPVAKGMAGACVALVESAMCAAHNPATLVDLDTRWEVGASLFAPDRGFVADDNAASPSPTGPASVPPGRYDSRNKLFLIPHFAYNRKLDADTSLGVALGGNGGMNTDYDSAVWRNFAPPPGMFPGAETLQASSPTGVDLMQLFLGGNCPATPPK